MQASFCGQQDTQTIAVTSYLNDITIRFLSSPKNDYVPIDGLGYIIQYSVIEGTRPVFLPYVDALLLTPFVQ